MIIRQRGSLTLGLAITIALLMVALSALGWLYNGALKDKATAEANVLLWQEAANDCSEATDKAKADADKRAKAAQDALHKAREDGLKGQAEIDRLKAAKPTAGAACPASDAVEQVRRGLK
jgi:Flp pilus assembly protein TadB